MRVILNEEEILTAIENYILDNVTVPDELRIDIDLKATRGDLGYTAEIDIVDENAPVGDRSVPAGIEPRADAENLGIVEKINAAKAQAAAPRRRGRPAGSRNKPKDTVVAAPEQADLAPVEQAAVTEPVATTEAVEIAPSPEPEAVTEPATEVAQVADPVEQYNIEPETETVTENQPATAAEVVAADVSTQATDTLTAEVSDAEPVTEVEAVAEPVSVEEANEPVATADEPTAEAEAEAGDNTPEADAPVPTEAPRSLFANLSKPTNG